MSKLIAWAVHLLTASGAALAFGAAVAAGRSDWQIVFVCLGAALIVDGIDGPIARRFHVKERLPWFDGAAQETPVYRWAALGAGDSVRGPAFIESEQTTVVVYPGQEAAADAGRNLFMREASVQSRAVLEAAE